jgi:hypothetical protein
MVVFGALLVCVLVTAGGAAGAATLTDPAGDAVGGAADITQVAVSNDEAGNITFAFTLGDRAALTPDDLLLILLDVDRDAMTGFNGIDFGIAVTTDGAVLLRAAPGSTFAPAPQPTLRTEDNGKTVVINRSDLGETRGFVFAAATALESNADAEDATLLLGYDLGLKPVLENLTARFSPAKPKAGRPFRLRTSSLRLDDGSIVHADAVTCVAKIGGKRLAGGCSWRIPKSAKGKRLTITLTARYEGVSATFSPRVFRVA